MRVPAAVGGEGVRVLAAVVWEGAIVLGELAGAIGTYACGQEECMICY